MTEKEFHQMIGFAILLSPLWITLVLLIFVLAS